MPEPFTLSVAEAAAQIRSGSLSPVTLAQSLLDRIDALDPALQAWVTIDREEVLNTARQRELELEQKGPKGPVHGVPVGLKDIFYTAGMKTTACSRIYADFVPSYDATCVGPHQGGRGHRPGESSDHRVRNRRSLADAQSVEPGAYARGL